MTQSIQEILEEFETAYVNHGDRFSELKEFLKTKLEQVVEEIPEGEGCRNGDPCYEILEDKLKAYQDELTK